MRELLECGSMQGLEGTRAPRRAALELSGACVSAPLQDPRIERLPCTHKGTYADDCICERVKQHRCYIVATCDRDLRRRIRKVGLGRRRGPGYCVLDSCCVVGGCCVLDGC